MHNVNLLVSWFSFLKIVDLAASEKREREHLKMIVTQSRGFRGSRDFLCENSGMARGMWFHLSLHG